MAVNVKVDLSLWKRKVRPQIQDKLNEAIKDVTFDLEKESVSRAPINKDLNAPSRGELRKSAQSSFDESKITGAVSYGGSLATDYALIQHERTDFIHLEGEAKYLEKPLMENQKKYITFIQNTLKRFIGN